MPDENKPVNGETAAPQAVNESAAAAEKKAKDAEAKLAKAEAELMKEKERAENYKAGLLSRKEFDKAKRKLTAEDLSDPSKIEAHVEAVITDRELDRKAEEDAQKALAEAAEVKKLREDNAELARSLEAAKAAGGGSASASGVDPASVSKPQGYWSAEQKAEIRQIYESHGYTKEQVDKMVARAEQMAQTNSATSERGNDLVKKRPN